MIVETPAMKKAAVDYDKQAFMEIYEHYSPDLFHYAYRLLDDNDLAEDCVADTFYRFLIAMRHDTQSAKMHAFLYRTAHNWIKDHQRHRLLTVASLEDDSHFDADGNLSHLLAREMDHQRVRAALLRLPAKQRQVIALRQMEDRLHHEVVRSPKRGVEIICSLQDRAVDALRLIRSEQIRLKCRMSELTRINMELDAYLERKLEASGVTPSRDPESARHTCARLVAELDKIFVVPTTLSLRRN